MNGYTQAQELNEMELEADPRCCFKILLNTHTDLWILIGCNLPILISFSRNTACVHDVTHDNDHGSMWSFCEWTLNVTTSDSIWPFKREKKSNLTIMKEKTENLRCYTECAAFFRLSAWNLLLIHWWSMENAKKHRGWNCGSVSLYQGVLLTD